jgi:hypothetical protein
MDGVFSDLEAPGEMLTDGRCAVRLSKGVTASNQGNRLGVIHPHSSEGFTNVEGRRLGVTAGVGALRVDIDEAHVSGGKGRLQVVGTSSEVRAAVVADVVALRYEGRLGAPEDALVRLPGVWTAGAKAKDRDPHGLEGRVAGQDDQVSPRNGLAILLFYGPQ